MTTGTDSGGLYTGGEDDEGDEVEGLGGLGGSTSKAGGRECAGIYHLPPSQVAPGGAELGQVDAPGVLTGGATGGLLGDPEVAEKAEIEAGIQEEVEAEPQEEL